jgi:RND superfamily putative drug exporter
MKVWSTCEISTASARHRWPVIAAWIVIFVLGGIASSVWLSDALTTEAEFVNSPESQQGLDLLEERFGWKDPLTETIVLTSDSLTVDDPEFKAVADKVYDNVVGLEGIVNPDPTRTINYYTASQSSDPQVASAAKNLVSEDRSTLLMPVLMTGDLSDLEDEFDRYDKAVSEAETDAVKVESVGDLTINDVFSTTAEEDIAKAEAIGIPIALIILIVVFGAILAALIPIGLAILAIVVAYGMAAVLGQWFDLSIFIQNIITLIGLAVGIDYSLFIIARYREERRHGRSRMEAIDVTGGTATKAIVFSGLTVVFALLGMVVVPFTIFVSLGVGAIFAVLVAVAATLTLVPAVLSILGDRIDWPRRRKYDAETVARQAAYDRETIHKGFWGRIARVVMEHPWPALLAAGGLLLVLCIPVLDLNTGFAGVETFPEGETKDAFDLLDEKFDAGRLSPVEIVVDATESDQVNQALEKLTASLTPEQGYAFVQPAIWNDARDTAWIRATLQADPNDPAAYDAVKTLRNDFVPAAFDGSDGDVFVTGDTAYNQDFFDMADQWRPYVFAFVLGLSFILLMVAFRSIVVPTKAIIMNLLSVGAAYGLLVLVFQKGYGNELFGFQETPTIEAWIPLFLFSILFGLSMDYQVFLLSRIREHYDMTGRNTESVATGLQSTARIITGAALIMVVVFAGFAAGSLVSLQQVGFGLAVAVFLDATIVRSILVPATMRLLGDWNWYLPKWLHWLPDLRIEGTPRPLPAAPEVAPAD